MTKDGFNGLGKNDSSKPNGSDSSQDVMRALTRAFLAPVPLKGVAAQEQQASTRTQQKTSTGKGKPHKSKSNQARRQGKKTHTFCETTRRIGFQPAAIRSPIGYPDTHRLEEDGKSLHRPGAVTLWFGVIAPLTVMTAELITHDMAKTFFDPFPTPFHVLLFLLIPISNFVTWLSVRLNVSPLYSMMSLASGMALGIAILYSVMFSQIVMPALAQGALGLAPLAITPLLSIPVTLMCGKTICQLANRQLTFFDAHQLKHLGHVIILVMVIAIELPSTLTRMHLSMAADPNTQEQGIAWLRQWGSPEVLLRACYERTGEPTDILGSLAEHQHPVSVDQAQDIYYKVTGVAYNSVPIPASFRGTLKNNGSISDPDGLNDGVDDEFDLDPDIAGELVSGVARGLSVKESAIAANLDAGSHLATLDLTFSFDNVSRHSREARTRILLPPNAVVTNATMWLDDQEVHTTITERSLARETYHEAVVNNKRDPLLVSMAGKDAVLVQCYPVSNGTRTKIRLHIVAPMQMDGAGQDTLLLPTFEERNFAINAPHQLELTSNSMVTLSDTGLKAQEKNSVFSLKGDLENSMLSRMQAILKVQPLTVSSSEDMTLRPSDGTKGATTQANGSSSKQRPLIVLVDQSVTMSPYIGEIIQGLKQTPASFPMSLVQVHDKFKLLGSTTGSGDPKFQSALKTIESTKCEGGQSDASALEWIFSSGRGQARDVLWIHAAQPSPQSNLPWTTMELLNKGTSANTLYDLQVASGPNEILKDSYQFPRLERVVRTGKLSDDIARLLANLAQGKRTVNKTDTTIDGISDPGLKKELAQLKANQLAMARYYSGDLQGAFQLASRYSLVTPVSSAVVMDEVQLVEKPIKEDKRMQEIADKLNPLKSLIQESQQEADVSRNKRLEDLNFYGTIGGTSSGAPATESSASSPVSKAVDQLKKRANAKQLPETKLDSFSPLNQLSSVARDDESGSFSSMQAVQKNEVRARRKAAESDEIVDGKDVGVVMDARGGDKCKESMMMPTDAPARQAGVEGKLMAGAAGGGGKGSTFAQMKTQLTPLPIQPSTPPMESDYNSPLCGNEEAQYGAAGESSTIEARPMPSQPGQAMPFSGQRIYFEKHNYAPSVNSGPKLMPLFILGSIFLAILFVFFRVLSAKSKEKDLHSTIGKQ